MKRSLFSVVLFAMYENAMSYNMGNLITCYEQNDEVPDGFKDAIWNDPSSSSCLEYPELHLAYTKNGPHPGKGDVCDHVDPITSLTRDSCYFNVIFGPEVNEEKTWSYKCWQFARCPVLDDEGNPKEGVQVTPKRINACCKDDFCNGNDLIRVLAVYGEPEKYPPNFQEICDIDFASYGIYVKFNVPGYEHCSYDPDSDNYEISSDSPEATTGSQESESSEEEEEGYTAAHSGILHNLYHNDPPAQIPKSDEIVNVADILLIFTYFVIGIACLAIGIFIGTKWQNAVIQKVDDNKLEI